MGRNPSGGEGLEAGDEDAEAVGSDVGHKVRIVAATDCIGLVKSAVAIVASTRCRRPRHRASGVERARLAQAPTRA